MTTVQTLAETTIMTVLTTVLMLMTITTIFLTLMKLEVNGLLTDMTMTTTVFGTQPIPTMTMMVFQIGSRTTMATR